MNLIQTINWKPFSKKHKRYIKQAVNSRMCVAEGAIRSGKTIDHCIIASSYLETCKDKIHLASGSTLGNAKLNIGDCNGFGLEHLFRGRCRWGKYKDNEGLFIQTKTGEKVVIFVGGGKADSYKRILGNSYGLWIATEINEHYDSDDSRTSFIKVAFGRQLAADRPFVLWDLNPCNPNNKIYTDYIDKYKESYKGYLYQHFTINDNLSISEERKAEIMQQYVPGSVWYRRDIEGERCLAEGLIYPMYEEAIELPPDKDEEGNEIKPSEYCMSLDYGTENPLAAYIYAKYGDTWYVVEEYYYNGRESGRTKTDSEYGDDIEVFTASYRERQSRKLEVIVDPSAASFKAELKRRGLYRVRDADNAVNDGIRETATCMQTGKIKISTKCENLIQELGGYIWDKDDKPLKENDHGCDALRYFIKTKKIAKMRKENGNANLSRFEFL